MKRIAALSLALLLGASLVACGGKSKPMAAASPANDTTEAMPETGAAAGDPASASDDESDGSASKAAPPTPDSDDPCGGDE